MSEKPNPARKAAIMAEILGKSWVDSDPKIFALFDAAWKIGRDSCTECSSETPESCEQIAELSAQVKALKDRLAERIIVADLDTPVPLAIFPIVMTGMGIAPLFPDTYSRPSMLENGYVDSMKTEPSSE